MVSTGETHTVRELDGVGFANAGLDWKEFVKVDEAFFRPAEVDILIGDPKKARAKLGWQPRVSFKELVQMMVDGDLARVRAGATR